MRRDKAAGVIRVAAIQWRLAVVCVGVLVGFRGGALGSQELPPAERRSPDRITVVDDKAYPPFVFLSSEGIPRGITVDIWRLWSRKTGIQVDFRPMEWREALAAVREGRADAVGGMFRTPEREAHFDFTSPLHRIEVAIFFHDRIAGIRGLQDLAGFRVGCVGGDSGEELLGLRGREIDPVVYPDLETLVSDAVAGKLRVFVADVPAARFYLSRSPGGDVFRQSPAIGAESSYAGVRKGNLAMLQTIQAGLDRIEASEIERIVTRWHGRAAIPTPYVRVLAWATGSAVALLVAAYAWSVSLRRKVRSATREIQDMNRDLRDKQEQLARSEAQYRQLVEGANSVILRMDRQGTISYFNPFAERFFGYAAKDIVGRNVVGTIVPETDSAGRDLRAMVADIGTRPEYYAANENENTRRDGTPVWLSWTNCPLYDASGQVSEILCVANDITARKEAEEALRRSGQTFRNVVQAIPMGIHMYELQADDRLVFVGGNPAADRLLGTDHRAFLGKTIEEAFPPLRETEIPERYRRAAQDGESWYTEQVAYNHGEIRGIFEVHAFQMSPRQVAVLFSDITARKAAESEREKLQNQLLQAQKLESVGRLAGGVAHDFNNMLHAILGYTELALEETDTDSSLNAALIEIRRAAERSADLTRQLLAFARRQTISPRVLVINDTVGEMLGMLVRLIGEDIRFVWVPGHDIWPVRVDPMQVGMVLANLCVNARDAIAGTGRITIASDNTVIDDAFCTTHVNARAGDYVMLAVSDDGCGMDETTMASVFEPFFTTKEVGKGTGLGLATVHGIALQNDGFVTVESEVGKGTTFRVYLPRCTGPEADAGAAAGPVPLGALPRGRETILVVEDESVILAVCREVLGRLGYAVLSAGTPSEAIELASRYGKDIDLLITDVVMPEMDGRRLVGIIAGDRPDLPCIYMSGYTADAIAHHGVLDPGLHFLPKPFSAATLATLVRNVLDARRAERGPVTSPPRA